MYFVTFVLALLSSWLFCLGIILTKWILDQIGITLFVMILAGMMMVIVLAIGDKEHDE
jgi:4-hydroxybenzoate polyprenyltransferase